MRDNVTDIGVWRRRRQSTGRGQEIAALERRMARAFIDYQRAIVEGQLAEELDELLEEVERAVGDYQAFMGTPTVASEPPLPRR